MSNHNDLFYFKSIYLEECNKCSLKILNHIDYCSKLNKVNDEILFSVILLEKINRGDFFNRFLERIITHYFPKLSMRYDMSIGVGQLKISTVKRILGLENITEIIKILNDKFSNIMVVSLLISEILNDINKVRVVQEGIDKDLLNEVASIYLTGSSKKLYISEVSVYAELLNWSYTKKLFNYAKSTR